MFGGRESSYGASSIPMAVRRWNSSPGPRIKTHFKHRQEKLRAALPSSIIYAKLRFPLFKQPQPA